MEKYFKQDTQEKKVIFTGETLEVYIQERYENYGYLQIGETVVALAVFDMVIDGSVETGFLLPAVVRMDPSHVERIAGDSAPMYKLTFVGGDTFIGTEVVKDENIAYVLFDLFIQHGKLPKFLTYDMGPAVFDMATRITGMEFGVDHSIFEMFFAFLYRTPENPAIQYRHTDMKQPGTFVPLQKSAFLAESTTSKLVGAYFDDGIDSALLNAADNENEIEELLRK